ncbi:mpv17-like protein isoform X2 [Liolophura sinensis]|uniref:mpv17-like protein isoform X2 n=1 Tax=Liolophura sinensis TaxID=3198878 RepID=UPI0031585597
MAGIFQRLRSLFHRYPLASNMVICGSLYGSGDISQQKLRGKQLDWKNTGRIAFIAFTMFGPIYFHWYRVLDRIVKGKGTSSVVSKVLLDQFVMGPPCIGIFYVGTSILEGKEDVLAEFKSKGMKTFVAESGFWLPFQSVNFLFLPTHLRTAFVSMGAFAWSNVLCYIKAGRYHQG